MSRLMIVDDDQQTCRLLETAASTLFTNIEVFNDATQFVLQSLHSDDIVLLDLMMPTLDGIETIRKLDENGCEASLILMSGYDPSVLRSAEELARDHGLKVVANLTKPISIGQLTRLLSNELSNQKKATVQQNLVTPNQLLYPESSAAAFVPSVADLREAIDQNHLVLYYQPQVCLKTACLSGVEALVRWLHPEHGLIYPDSFITMAEQSGLIGDLTANVIEQAVNQSASWQKQGNPIKISVNISAQNIVGLTMPEQLKSLVSMKQLDPGMLMLEITESALMGELTTALDILTRLRLKGFRLSIDDFGTGFSSLSQLHRIPFTELKVDQSFVMHMIEDAQSCAIVETCIMLGHKLDMSVVAEGVEDYESLQLLKILGCDIVQGYYIAKPMPAEKLLNWLAQNNMAELIGG